MGTLDRSFPFRDIFESFLDEYSRSATYWYVPKARVLSDENVGVMAAILNVIFDEFLERVWNVETQDAILVRLTELQIVSPSRSDSTKVDRTALIRIWKKLFDTLGLLWVQEDKEIIITDAGLDLLGGQAGERRSVVERQVIKYQYPNPSLSRTYREDFAGILPYIFLLEVLMKCDHRITFTEYELFVNLATSQDDVGHICRYIHSWRDISDEEKELIMDKVVKVPMAEEAADGEADAEMEPEGEKTRYNRIRYDASYQRSFFAFPSYVGVGEGDIICPAPDRVEQLLEQVLPSLKITKFRAIEDWFAYFGDPKRQASWATYLISLLEDAATNEEVTRAKSEVEEHRELLGPAEAESVERAQIEKDIETFYCAHLDKLEEGLVLTENGRQFPTPIGRIDLLCMSKEGEHVVVEVKAQEARDSVFGQILRYMGWVHRNVEGVGDRIRGIIVASKFPETARYSRIGLLKPDYQNFIKFKEYKL
ncbi:MAG: AlwI family type II restriction endonuclease [Planctomycetes bacterium]|nr:AlwI family type II restriction endonuclease [Planctomycetota bacterium]